VFCSRSAIKPTVMWAGSSGYRLASMTSYVLATQQWVCHAGPSFDATSGTRLQCTAITKRRGSKCIAILGHTLQLSIAASLIVATVGHQRLEHVVCGFETIL